MPHLTIEYTRNIEGFHPAETLAAVNAVLLASGEFGEADVKSRAIRVDDFQIGAATATGATPRGFIHGTLALLSGRSAETKKQLSDDLMGALQTLAKRWGKNNIQISIEIRDMDRACYGKATLGA